jgi:guanine deaminase
MFLGSGLFDLALADRHGVRLGIGTDIGAGTTLSILHTLGEAYRTCQLREASLDPFRALHLATAGGARVMGIADRVGGPLPGREADFVVLDTKATPLLARRCAGASLHDRRFALQVLSDDRHRRHLFARPPRLSENEFRPPCRRLTSGSRRFPC